MGNKEKFLQLITELRKSNKINSEYEIEEFINSDDLDLKDGSYEEKCTTVYKYNDGSEEVINTTRSGKMKWDDKIIVSFEWAIVEDWYGNIWVMENSGEFNISLDDVNNSEELFKKIIEEIDDAWFWSKQILGARKIEITLPFIKLYNYNGISKKEDIWHLFIILTHNEY